MLNEDYKLSLLWDKIEERFAKDADVKKLAQEMKCLEENQETSISAITKTAAAIVLRSVKHEVERLGHFSVEIVPFLDNNGFPGVEYVSFNKLYLTPCMNGAKNYEWHKWIAIPSEPKGIGDKPYKWERIGYDKIDLSWVKADIKDINESICKLESRLKQYSKSLAQMVLNKAIKPLDTLKRYVTSKEYIDYLYEQFPRASLTQDGLMTSGQYALLNALTIWASCDYTQIGGGALNDCYVANELKRFNVKENPMNKCKKH